MPVNLPQISRREFLRRAALAGVACSALPKSFALPAGKVRDPNFFALFSDTHIAANPAEVHLEVNMSDHLTACIRELDDWPVAPTATMVNGDLAFLSGKSSDYSTFNHLIEPLRLIAPVHLSLGNHDERDNFWEAFPSDTAAVRTSLHRQAAVVPSQLANWFLLDSLETTDHTPGFLGRDQLNWLAQELDSRPDKPAIVVLHHNPQFAKIISTGLRDTHALMTVIAPRAQVKLVIFGHTHDWHISQHESGIHLANLPPTAYVFVAGRPSGWVRATLADDGIELELRTLNRKHPQHGDTHHLKWRNSGAAAIKDDV